MKFKLTLIAAALALGFTAAAQAADNADRKARNAEQDRIKADYKADMAKCKPMKGSEKDVCQADAKGKEKVAKAELTQKYEPSPKHARDVEEAKAEHEYKVAKEKCDAQKGKEESACEKEAKANYERAKADIKAKHASDDSRRAPTGATAPASGKGR